ncbi:hypothetical protein Tco_0390251 [Tanacetum coccineum]
MNQCSRLKFLVQAQQVGQIFYMEEELAFLADRGLQKVKRTQTCHKLTMLFIKLNLDAYHSDCDELNTAKLLTWRIYLTKDLFSTFNQQLVDELAEVQNVFYQMEQAVEQHRVESKTFEVKMNQALNENERLLEQVMSKDIVNLIVNSSMDYLPLECAWNVKRVSNLRSELCKGFC